MGNYKCNSLIDLKYLHYLKTLMISDYIKRLPSLWNARINDIWPAIHGIMRPTKIATVLSQDSDKYQLNTDWSTLLHFLLEVTCQIWQIFIPRHLIFKQLQAFIIYKVIKYRKIFIKNNAYFKKAVFHSLENIKSCISQPWKYKLYFMGEIGCPLLSPLTSFSPLQNYKGL